MRWRRTPVLSLALLAVLAAPVAAVTLAGPRDVPQDSVHADAIDWLGEHGISGGCAPELFCPNDDVSRAQLATFLQRLANAGVVDAATVEGLTAAQLQGQVGPEGPRGATGPAGPAGPEGDPGPIGETGPVGDAGQDGNTILGQPGAPDTGLGSIGDLYLDTATLDLYGPKDADGWGAPTSLIGAAGEDGQDGAPGADGQDGAPGADGVDGVDGRTWLTGAGAPDASLGVDGDLYLDTAADTFYGPKAAGVWGAGTSLIGPQGEQGIQGIQGIQGPKGDTGEQGPEGPAGTVAVAEVSAPSATTISGGNANAVTSTATCPAGQVVLSGGYRITANSLGEDYTIAVTESRPSGTNAWIASAADNYGNGGTITAYALCTTEPV